MILALRRDLKLLGVAGLMLGWALFARALDEGSRAGFLSGESAPQAKAPTTAVQQKILDLLAQPIPADSSLPKLPASYAEWSAEEQRTYPRQLEARCGVLWRLMNSGGKLQLLPSAQDAGDTTKLVSEVCVTGKMPRDWPGRAASVADIRRILERSRDLGDPLSVPAGLEP